MDTTPLKHAYATLLAAAVHVAERREQSQAPTADGWDPDRILAHIALVDAATLATAATVASGAGATYDNRLSHEDWTISRVHAHAGGSSGLQDRVRRQGEALCALGATLSDAELATVVPALLLSDGEAMVDEPVSLATILTGLAEDHLPRHTEQLLALVRTGPQGGSEPGVRP